MSNPTLASDANETTMSILGDVKDLFDSEECSRSPSLSLMRDGLHQVLADVRHD